MERNESEKMATLPAYFLRCKVCGGQATRSALYPFENRNKNLTGPLYCDDHGPQPGHGMKREVRFQFTEEDR